MTLEILIPRFDPEDPRSAVENMKRLADSSGADILAFIHDDVDIIEPHWEFMVEKRFRMNPKLGMLGFGGALGLGTDEIYKVPYKLQQLARIDFCSNMTDAETHGRRVREDMQVAVLDGFSQIIRRSAYEAVGGWEAALKAGLSFHMYDAWMACMLARHGYEIWLLPLQCTHHGGKTSTSKEYDEWLRSRGINGDLEIHQTAHVIIYEEFRDVLPLRV